ncbi:adenosine 3'-phospho 5'-phosphosulfate transporter, putative [Pediculus humanus corporis]|uniref:Adenosine 3'-phospho 5'-phosphosulfate transporter 1 n=1 Tax=Pediculus humanus subsp. corporis TaxID=121224 RepID=E0VC49_PEDHC|nr:adenosine 3'-phospho 5'-phosphosulfate transporter, putative [Pediculus humanus corporis]EEB10955.1 adenosine 3'-phospho 5'-phosphosulfate transporter, putative [Pediculus humanus corporis]
MFLSKQIFDAFNLLTAIKIIILGSLIVIYITTQLFKKAFEESSNEVNSSLNISNNFNNSWIFRLILNLLGYATTKYLEKFSGSGLIGNIVKLCFVHSDNDRITESAGQVSLQKTVFQEALTLIFCFSMLQLTYLTWGILQEKVMTQEYVDSSGNKDHFTDSQFLVFINRILAFGISGSYLLFTNQHHSSVPMYKYIFCSFSNIMSSWCQYESLKFISFPTQVLAKASKIIPVMMMGKLVSRKKYEYYEYVTAVLISIGMTFFMLGSKENKAHDNVTTFSGIILLAAYLIFDSFTSNWQGVLFSQFHMSSVQMMCGVNLFSCLFTTVSLIQQGGFIPSIHFMINYHKFMFDCLLLSICSAAGQLFIFYTISNFGAVVFVIIMTIRQGLAILLSCLIYHHNISPLGILGIFLVFISVFLRIYCNQRLKAINRKRNLLVNNVNKV